MVKLKKLKMVFAFNLFLAFFFLCAKPALCQQPERRIFTNDEKIRFLNEFALSRGFLKITCDGSAGIKPFVAVIVSKSQNSDYFHCLALPDNDSDNESRSASFLDVHLYKKPEMSINSRYDNYPKELNKSIKFISLDEIKYLEPEIVKEPLLGMFYNYKGAMIYLRSLFSTSCESISPIKYTLDNDTERLGVVCNLNQNFVDSAMNLEQGNSIYNSQPEFTFRKTKELPLSLADGLLNENIEPEFKSYRILAGEPITQRPGLVTDKFLWMGIKEEGVLGIQALCGYLNTTQNKSVYGISIMDENGNINNFGIGEMRRLSKVSLVDNDTEKMPFLKYEHNINMLRELKTAWEKENEDIYILFNNRFPFSGRLVEYINSYDYSRVLHAVVENEQGDFILLRDLNGIKEIIFSSSIPEREKIFFDNALPDKFIKNKTGNTVTITPDMLEEKPVKLMPQEEPGKPLKLSVLKIQYGGDETKRFVYDNDGIYKGYKLLNIKLKINMNKNAGKPFLVYYDEFSLYAKSKNLAPYPYRCMVVDGIPSDSISVSGREKVFNMVFLVNPKNNVSYLNIAGITPVKIEMPKEE